MAKKITIISSSSPTAEPVGTININLENPDHNNTNVTIGELKKNIADSLGTYQVDGLRKVTSGKIETSSRGVLL